MTQLTYILLATTLMLFSHKSIGQSKVSNDTNLVADTIGCILAEEFPRFPGGEKALKEYIHKKIENKILTLKDSTTVNYARAQFTIAVSGKVKNIRIITTSNSPNIDSLIIKAIEQMPLWTPGKQNGKKVEVKYILPLRIRTNH